jgi:hypothetical protein
VPDPNRGGKDRAQVTSSRSARCRGANEQGHNRSHIGGGRKPCGIDAPRERPRRRAAEQRDELPPLYLTELHLTLDEPGLRRRISN